MSLTLAQIYALNPITTNLSTDLMYFSRSPYSAGLDRAMTYSSFAAQFGAPFTPAALTEVNDTNVTMTLGGAPATSLLEAVSMTLGWTGQLALTRGGTNASLTASNGGMVYSTGSALAILAGTATANQIPLSGANSAPAWSTATYLDTMTLNSILFASSANVMGQIAPAANSVLISGAGSIPAMSQTLPSAVQGNITVLGVQAQALNMGGFKVTSAADPTLSTDLATKNYVDTLVAGLNPIPGVNAASISALTVTYNNGVAGVGATLTNAGAQAALVIDGYTTNVNDRILIKNQASSLQNGIYVVTSVGSGSTNWVLTRSNDYNTPGAINVGDLVVTESGSQMGSSWVETASVTTIGVDPITFSVFFSPGSYASSTLTSAFFYVGNGSNVATGVAMSGDTTLSNTGVVTIGANKVTNAKLATMADQTVKGNVSGGSAAPSDLTATQMNTFLGTKPVSQGGTGLITFPAISQARLTLQTNVPVPVSDVTAATTLYYTPYGGNVVCCYDGAEWKLYNLSQISIAVPASTSQMYDVFLYDNAGTLTLELLAWTNDTTRATNLLYSSGVLVKTGDITRKYVGSIRTTTVSGQCEDSLAKRYVYNAYNRVRRPLRVLEATDSWTYSTGSYRQANNNAANQLDFIQGLQDDAVEANVIGIASSSGATNRFVLVGIGLSSTTAKTANCVNGYSTVSVTMLSTVHAGFKDFPQLGRQTLVWLEYGGGTDTQTWYGDNGGVLLQSGIQGIILA
jgi:hypothetical protein